MTSKAGSCSCPLLMLAISFYGVLLIASAQANPLAELDPLAHFRAADLIIVSGDEAYPFKGRFVNESKIVRGFSGSRSQYHYELSGARESLQRHRDAIVSRFGFADADSISFRFPDYIRIGPHHGKTDKRGQPVNTRGYRINLLDGSSFKQVDILPLKLVRTYRNELVPQSQNAVVYISVADRKARLPNGYLSDYENLDPEDFSPVIVWDCRQNNVEEAPFEGFVPVRVIRLEHVVEFGEPAWKSAEPVEAEFVEAALGAIDVICLGFAGLEAYLADAGAAIEPTDFDCVALIRR